ncbi:hypothetical protein IJG28_03485 [Candidatus Saccharibacteria bacterium]|nr:hypothetical protein [Candidatus Saccharibacteria bacterium]
MFFDDVSEIKDIAKKCGTAVFVVPRDVLISIPQALVVEPDGKTVVTIEQVRELTIHLKVKQFDDLFVVIRPADALQPEAANALLKNLEEPTEKIHFVLITDSPSLLLPTILSRAAIYILREKIVTHNDINASEQVKNLAKRLLVARGSDLVTVAEEITRKKDGSRRYALEVIGVAIEMLYKTYFITEKKIFLEKLPKFLAAYDAISRNGNAKLQIVANLC